MKKLQPFAVRTANLTEEQLADMFLLAEKAGAVIDEGNEELRNRRGGRVSVFDKDMYELAGVDVDFDTRIDDGAESFIQNDEDHAFYLFASYEDACDYLNGIIERKIESSRTEKIVTGNKITVQSSRGDFEGWGSIESPEDIQLKPKKPESELKYSNDGEAESLHVGGDCVYVNGSKGVSIELEDIDTLSDVESLLKRLRAL